MRKPKVLSALGRGRSQRGQSCLLDPHITLCIRYTFRLDLLLKWRHSILLENSMPLEGKLSIGQYRRIFQKFKFLALSPIPSGIHTKAQTREGRGKMKTEHQVCALPQHTQTHTALPCRPHGRWLTCRTWEYIEFSMFTVWIGSQAAQMFVNATTSLKRIVQVLNSPATYTRCQGQPRR